MRTLLKAPPIAVLLACSVLLSWASKHEKTEGQELQSPDGNMKMRRNFTAAHFRRHQAGSQRRKVMLTGSRKFSIGPGSEIACNRLGGICQPERYICQGRYLKDKCSGSKTRQCCMPVGAWSVFCAGHHNNRVRACDVHGCGAFNSKSGNDFHKAVDLVCDDYGTIKAPFSGFLAGPVSGKDSAGNQYDGVKLINDVHCVKIFNIRPYRYTGLVVQGEELGYLLPMQERFPGITSHLELQMCDRSDPSTFI